jgi:hypothetical protein
MMNGHEKSDPAIVAVKLANKAERSVAEPVEPRVGAEGSAEQAARSGHRAGTARQTAWVACGERPKSLLAAIHPRWEPYAGKPHVRICAGGAQ